MEGWKKMGFLDFSSPDCNFVDRLRGINREFPEPGKNRRTVRSHSGHSLPGSIAHFRRLGPPPGVPEPSSSNRAGNFPSPEDGSNGSPLHDEICRPSGAVYQTSGKDRPLESEDDREHTCLPAHGRNSGQERVPFRHPARRRRTDNSSRLDCHPARGSGDRFDLPASPSSSKEHHFRKACR